ncbi:hypothetical protein M2322_002656 [Rhodoblastus acidophilus]|uniref:hypothetical protein n=1 Tax=Rhodoblastus acidophilus TaxID=1074 RepID=UPI002225B0C8|nr:hypothetical protein [Rhodoblastus acidophilus]MCW2317102.1 hypothetical protein [Rhodoblastus acidophilus]
MTLVNIAPDALHKRANAVLKEAAPYGRLTAPALRPLNKDALAMVPRTATAQASHAALDQLQRERPEVMVAAAALLFAAICLRCQLEPDLMHRQGLKMLRPEAGMRRDNDSLQSLMDFAGIRIMGEREVGVS